MKEKSRKHNLILTLIVLAVIFMITAVTVIILLVNQRKPEQNNDINLSADDVVVRVIKKMNYINLTPISKQNINRYYEIPEDTVSDYAMYISGRSGTEVEIACFKMIDKESETALTSTVNDYLSDKSVTAPSNTSSLTNSSTALHIPYMLVVVAQDAETAAKSLETVLDESLKE